MEIISKVLFWVANSLLIPDIIILLILFARSLLLLGGFYNQFITKRKNDKIVNPLIETLTQESIKELQIALPKKDNSLYIKYLKSLLDNTINEAYADFTISNFENDLEKDLMVC